MNAAFSTERLVRDKNLRALATAPSMAFASAAGLTCYTPALRAFVAEPHGPGTMLGATVSRKEIF